VRLAEQSGAHESATYDPIQDMLDRAQKKKKR
jgi:hypothetical protein